jgi:hypothetical protein
MSSRELVDELFGIVTETDKDGKSWLVSADFLPEDSVFNTALRGGDSSPQEYREGRIINELMSAFPSGRAWDPWLSHGQRFAEKAHEDWLVRRHDENLAQLRGEG